jgi:hypothetical protein
VDTDLNSIIPLREMRLLLLLLLRDQARLLLRQPSPNGTSLFGPEVERDVFLVLVEQPQL